MRRILSGLAVVMLSVSCHKQPHVVLSVDAEERVAREYAALFVGESIDSLRKASTEQTTYPVSLTVSRAAAGEVELWVEARAGDGTTLGRGRTSARFRTTGTPTGSVTLALPCAIDADCDDGIFCTGAEVCDDGVCAAGEPPCRPSFPCDQTTCVEGVAGAGECAVSVDHGLCPPHSYCHTELGCVPGTSCDPALLGADCREIDGLVCNGDEQCVDFGCAGGPPPDLSDGNPCTFDGCNDALAEPIYHQPDPSQDGNSCITGGGADGICVAAFGGCVVSACGDGFRDALGGELCDDGNTIATDVCTDVCRPARCGDGVVWDGLEVCDDGGACPSGAACTADSDCVGDGDERCRTESGDGCTADCRKVELCGDGIVDSGEDCDDGNTNPNDGCHAVDRNVDPDGCTAVAWSAELLIGAGRDLVFGRMTSVAVGRDGSVYVSLAHRVVRVTPAGLSVVVAGTGTAGFNGDGRQATAAHLNDPSGVAVDGSGNLWIADTNNNRVRKVCTDGVGCIVGEIETVAGTGTPGYNGDGQRAVTAELDAPEGVFVDGAGNLWIADTQNHRVRRVCGDGLGCVAGEIETVAGIGGYGMYSGDGSPAVSASLWEPTDIAVDAGGNVWIADSSNLRVRRVCGDGIGCTIGIIETVAGDGWTTGFNGDNQPAVDAALGIVTGVAVDAAGNLWIAATGQNRVRRVCGDGVGCTVGYIETVAGVGTGGFSGDGQAATSAQLDGPLDVALDTEANLWILDSDNRRVRRVCGDASSCAVGVIETVAGSGAWADLGDGGSATSALLSPPNGVAAAGNGDILIADGSARKIRRVCAGAAGCPAGQIETLADTGVEPLRVAADADGNVWYSVADSDLVRRVCTSGIGCTLGEDEVMVGAGPGGDGEPAVSASLWDPVGLAFDAGGNLYIGDTQNERVRRVCYDGVGCTVGTIDTVAGTGTMGYNGDNQPATSAQLARPHGVAIDAGGNIWIADTWGNRVRKVCVDGIGCTVGDIQTAAGTGVRGYNGDDQLATEAQLDFPGDVVVDSGGNVYIADFWRVRRICYDGVGCTVDNISTVAGGGGTGGDGGPAVDASLSYSDIDLDAADNLLIASWDRVRKVCHDGVDCNVGHIETIAGGPVGPIRDGPFARAELGSPRALAFIDPTTALVADGASGRVRRLDFAAGGVEFVVGYASGFADGADPLAQARFSRLLEDPVGVVVVDDASPYALVVEGGGHCLRRVGMSGTPHSWTVDTFAGTCGSPGCSPASATTGDLELFRPSGLAYDDNLGVVYLADAGNQVVRSIDLGTGGVSVLAGTVGEYGYFGDGTAASGALLREPSALALGPGAGGAPNRSLYVADTANNRVRKIDLDTGIIANVCGDGSTSSAGEGPMARDFPVDSPAGVAVDRYGNLYFSSRTALRQVAAGSDGIADGNDTVRTIYGRHPRIESPENVTICLTGVTIAPATPADELVFFLDECQGYLLALHRGLDRAEDCSNGVDDNGNTLVDCADRTCAGAPACE